MKLRYVVPIIALLIFAPLIAGCGGGGSSEAADATAEDASLSKAEFTAKADALCAKTYEAIDSLQPSGEFVAEAKQVTTLYMGLIDDLEGLGAPEESADYSAFLASAKALGKKESEAKAAAERKDSKKLGELGAEIGPLVEKFEKEAKAYGLSKCGEGP
jgi:hypothetical protein